MWVALKKLFVAFLFLLNALCIANGQEYREACLDDFSPCTCGVLAPGVVHVQCAQVYGLDIRRAFNQSTHYTSVYRLQITVPPDCGFFPDEMLSGKSSGLLSIRKDSGSQCNLFVDSNAFVSPYSNYTSYLEFIGSSDMLIADFSFVKAFPGLQHIALFAISQQIRVVETLPAMPALVQFQVDASRGVVGMTSFPAGRSFNTLTDFSWTRGDLDDSAADAIFSSLAQSAAIYTLKRIVLEENVLTRMSPHLSYFENLDELNFRGNRIIFIESGSFLFHVRPPTTLSLYQNYVQRIEPSAFVGVYNNVSILLGSNQLTEFTADVFLQILEDMFHRGTGGSINLDNSRSLTCGCGIAWLIRDQRHLLGHISGGQCANGTYLEALNPGGYNNC